MCTEVCMTQVQTKVRKLCVDRDFESGGQLVVVWDTLTHMRKLYLFPGLMAIGKKITTKIILEILIIIHKLEKFVARENNSSNQFVFSLASHFHTFFCFNYP
ncbi:hypothetical protein EB796_012979 [Bugula neritina]|uniref:Uncharacterized protein n=1 Tax=Bugula neritina TaxID=10212 RepID=A0A7J7JQR3_BUGNE|nr:hypothetical protein EB796_012979 [Bugula neritina]